MWVYPCKPVQSRLIRDLGAELQSPHQFCTGLNKNLLLPKAMDCYLIPQILAESETCYIKRTWIATSVQSRLNRGCGGRGAMAPPFLHGIEAKPSPSKGHGLLLDNPPGFGRIRNKTCCIKRPWIATSVLNRSSRRKRGMASNPLFIIPDLFLHFPNELCYGYLRFEGNGKIPLGW